MRRGAGSSIGVAALIAAGWLGCACGPSGGGPGTLVSPPGDDDVAADDDTTPDDDVVTDDDATSDDDTTPDPVGECPAEMAPVWVGGAVVCVDRWEAVLDEVLPGGEWVPWSPYLAPDGVDVRARSAEGVPPQGYVSGDQAEAACLAAGKRLCTSEEWLAACRGPDDSDWPYGDERIPGECNDDYPGHPVVDYYGTADSWVWTSEAMNDPGINQQPGTLAATGSHAGCLGGYGTYDMAGNLHEWVADPDGTFRGGFYADAEINGEGCDYRTTAHSRSYHDYSTGFRCCLGGSGTNTFTFPRPRPAPAP